MTPVLTVSGLGGKWWSNAKLLETDADTGVAVAVGVGTADVFYTISDKQSTSTEVSIAAIPSLRFEDPTEKMVTDARRSGLFFPLSFRMKGGSLMGDNCSAEAVNRFMRQRVSPLTCLLSFTSESEINVDDVFSVKAEFDVKSGFYQCVIKPIGNPTAASSTLDTEVILKAQYSNLISAQLKLPFQPAVFLQTPEVHVSDLQPATHIVITGKPSLLRVKKNIF